LDGKEKFDVEGCGYHSWQIIIFININILHINKNIMSLDTEDIFLELEKEKILSELKASSLSEKCREYIMSIIEENWELKIKNAVLNDRITELAKEVTTVQEYAAKITSLPNQNNTCLIEMDNSEIDFIYVSGLLRKKRIAEFRLEEAIETQIWMNTFLSSFKEENINKWIKKTDLTIILDEEYVIHNAYIVTERWSLYAVYLHLRDKDKKQRD